MNEILPQKVSFLSLPTGAKIITDAQGYEDVWMTEKR
ncbi:immunity protein Imm33 domain-containing protein [Pseudomonas sp. NMS19W]